MRYTYPSTKLLITHFIALMLISLPTWAQASTPRTVVTEELPVFTDPGRIPTLETQIDGNVAKLPLQHTHVDVEITHGVARVEVTQSYKNLYNRPIEALYTFPLPMNSAVDSMQMVIGERTIQGVIKKRADARRIYEQAKKQGQTASLLEQERPNIFSQSVANIAPGTDIDIVVSYVQSLTYAANQWEFVFPMVVGPRFVPPGHPDGPGTESYKRLKPLVLGHGQRPGNDISMNIQVFSGSEVKQFHVPTHDVTSQSRGDGSLELTLASHDRIPNRDFILHFQTASALPTASVLTHREKNGGFFNLTVMPPMPNLDGLQSNKREFIFVVDISGSMRGVPLSMCKDAMKEALSQVRPEDTFNVLTFAGQTKKAFANPRRASQHNIREALAVVDRLRAGGGTMMAGAIAEALNPNTESQRERYVFFLTDGYVGNSKQLFAQTQNFVKTLSERGQTARVFGFGVGSSVNRHLLNGLSEAGRGVTFYASTRQDPAQSAKQFFRAIEKPILSDIHLEFEGVEVSGVEPQIIPDLLAGRPLEILGRYKHSAKGKVHIHGILNGQSHTMTVPFSLRASPASHAALKTRWARARVKSLTRQTWQGTTDTLKQSITQLGLDYGLVTAYTSFVAVDSLRQTSDGDAITIEQPTHIAEGVDPSAAGNRFQRRALPMFQNQSLQLKRGPNRVQAQDLPKPQMYGAKEKITRLDENTGAARYFLRVRGDLNRGTIVKTLKKAWKNASKCMIHKLFDPNKSGQRIEITVNSHGRVVAITIVGSGNQKKSDLCVREFFENVQFPKSRSGRSTYLVLKLKTLSNL